MGLVAYFGLCLLGCLLFNPTVEGAGNIRPRSLCPPGALHYGKACYEFLNNPLDWEKAEDSCQFQRNGHLASIYSAREEKFITRYICSPSCPLNVWIGFSVNKTLAWGWSDGSQYIKGSALWDGRKPSEPQCDQCISLTSVDPNAATKWKEDSCKKPYPYLCKYPALY